MPCDRSQLEKANRVAKTMGVGGQTEGRLWGWEDRQKAVAGNGSRGDEQGTVGVEQ